jgi:hypothetical protein
MNRTIYSLLLAAALTGAATAGTLTITLTNDDLSTTAGGTVTFQATAVNSDPINAYNFNADGIGALDPALTLDDTAFLNNWFSVGASSTFGPEDLFNVTVLAGTAPGPYLGSYNILGGPGANDQNLLATLDFTVTVTPATSGVPEPGTFAMMSAALLAGSVVLRRRARAS